MTGSFLLDTNIIVAVFRDEEAVLQKIVAAELVFIPSPALGELYLGALRSNRTADNQALVDEFANGLPILKVDQQTAREWANLKNALYLIGKPIPDNDIWIAALAKQHNCTVVTRDNHFDHIAAISRVSW